MSPECLTLSTLAPIMAAFPQRIGSMDQIPCPFVIQIRKQTLARAGADNGLSLPAWIVGPKTSGLDKRQATLMPCIRAGGEQVVPLSIILTY